jgi:hypothetical protein
LEDLQFSSDLKYRLVAYDIINFANNKDIYGGGLFDMISGGAGTQFEIKIKPHRHRNGLTLLIGNRYRLGDQVAQEDVYTRLDAHDGTPPIAIQKVSQHHSIRM